ncbi:MAG: hypothetical protein PHI41_02470 [Erysipelotrichaceae bacterium]|nr:hypothetical protein [Erysipelotrichaceae bacterium]MDD3809924.1 hypothetical protein [Erysipelotrichaceae bacterium]
MKPNIEGITRVEIAAFIGFGMIVTIMLIALLSALVCYLSCPAIDNGNSEIMNWLEQH